MILDLNFTNNKININQFDSDYIEFELLNDGLKLDMIDKIVKVFLRNEAGLKEANFTIKGNIVIINYDEFTKIAGVTGLQIGIEEAGKQIKTFILEFDVKASVFSEQPGNIIMDGVEALNKANIEASITKENIEKLIADGGVLSILSFNSFKKNAKFFNDRPVNIANDTNYGLDLANMVGQGLYPKGDARNNSFRAMVIHNYTDAEVLTLDNVGEMPTILIRNARNSQRRVDKPINFIPQSNYLQFQQGYMNVDANGNELDTHSFVTMFNMDYLGNLYWRNNRDDVQSIKLQTVSQTLASKGFAFTIGSYYNTRYIADFQYENNKSALKIAMDTTGQTQLLSQLNGMRHTANKGNFILESIEGSVILKGATGVYSNVGGVNLPLANFVATKPSSPTAQGNKGDYFADSLSLYVCYNPNLWIKLDKVSW